jgi:uncharacterized membrane protein YecN with MAPEG domain
MEYPVTAFYAALLGLLLIFLSNRVSRNRKRSSVSLGHGDDADLERAMRAQGNFIEYVPFGLILMLLLESEVTQSWALHLFGLMLLTGRLLHAYGMTHPEGALNGRFWGTALTWVMILAASLTMFWHLA